MTWLKVWIEINLVFVSGGIEIDLFSEWGETDLTSVLRSKLAWLLCAGSRLTCFQCRDRNWLDFCAGVKIASVFVCRLK